MKDTKTQTRKRKPFWMSKKNWEGYVAIDTELKKLHKIMKHERDKK